MAMGQPLGIIAGAGELPLALARVLREDSRPVFVLVLEGIADAPEIAEFPHARASIGELERAIGLLKDSGCSEVTLAGRVARPDFSSLKLDRIGRQNIGSILTAALKGDDALLRAVIAILEKHGLRVLGTADVTRSLLAPAGPIGKFTPGRDDMPDIEHGLRVVNALGHLDIGQAAVVCRGLVLAVEAAEGTDAMLFRICALPETLRGTKAARRGVLVKSVKPGQDRRIDLPVIGARTVELASAAGLSGIAVQQNAVLVLNRTGVAELADRDRLFVYGVDAAEVRA
jgi:DUF1009 family protein